MNVKIQFILQILLLSLLITICASCNGHQKQPQKVLKHVVAFHFKDNVTDSQKQEAIKIFKELEEKIPEIKKFEGGENLSDAGLNKNFSHWYVLSFENEEARDVYLPHPSHQEVVDKNKPLFEEVLVADYWGVD